MPFEIHPHEGAGPIRFGMSPNEVRSALGAEFESFRRTPQSVHPCDHFPDLQCFIYYNGSGGVEAMEFAEPASPIFGGVDLLSLGFSDLAERIAGEDPDMVRESDGFTSVRLGIGCYAPSAGDEPGLSPESVIVFAKGYYD